MILKLFRLPTLAALAVTFAAMAFAEAGAARDWRTAMQRHEAAAAATKFQPKGDNPKWDFDLRTMLNDFKWRARTTSMLRELPPPSAGHREDADPSQLADRPGRLNFRF